MDSDEVDGREENGASNVSDVVRIVETVGTWDGNDEVIAADNVEVVVAVISEGISSGGENVETDVNIG
jgi:hypothetical protein